MATIKVKGGVEPRLIHLLAGVANVAQKLNEPSEVWITSGTDGVHMKTSLHYASKAIDLRLKNFPTRASKLDFIAALRKELGVDYDLVWESESLPNEHLHVEYDPK